MRPTRRGPLDLSSRTVAAVVVTYRRPALLARCLAALATQHHRPDLLVVVDNDDDPAVEAVVAASPLDSVYLPSSRNLGGAGGYAWGVLQALAAGVDWVWLADDDGQPANEWVLSRLLVCAAENDLDVVSPLVLDCSDPRRLAFPLRQGLTWVRRADQLTGRTLLRGTANLFNGTLMSARAVTAVGVPDLRLFVRGDEVDLHRRVRASGLGFGTCPQAAYLHPGGTDDWQPLLGGRLHVLVPAEPARRERTYRNLGYLTAQRGLRWRRWPDAARYAWWYLVCRRDPVGARRWWRLAGQGRREQFPPGPDDPAATSVAAGRAGARAQRPAAVVLPLRGATGR